MAESTAAPEIKIATQEANGIISTPSKVEMKDFSREDLELIGYRLNVLRDNSASTLAKKEGSLIAKKEKLEKMIADLKTEKADAESGKDPKLTQDEVDSVITEDDFEKTTTPAEDKTKPTTIAEIKKILPENLPISQDVAKILDKNGIMPDGFLKKIFEWIHKNLGRSEISYDQAGMYNTVVGPYLKEKGFKVSTEVKGQDGEMMPMFDKDTGARIMKKLSSLGVPVAESGKFLGYIMGDIPEQAIDQKLKPLFDAGRDHYENTVGAEKDINIALNFIPPATTQEPEKEKPVDPNAPKDNEMILAGEKISGKPEDIKAYNSLSETAKKILGKSFDEKVLLAKIKDIKPEEKVTGAGKELFIQIVDALKVAYGNDFASKLGDKVDQSSKNLLTNFMDGATKIDAKTLPGLSEVINKNTEHIFWFGVRELENNILAWKDDKSIKDGEDDSYNDKIGDDLLASVKGHEGRARERKEDGIQKSIGEIGYAGLVAQNIAQKKHFESLKTTLRDKATVAAFAASKVELKTEIV